jgi:outer membrane protein OmpA-like peptidoglycan-associated protein
MTMKKILFFFTIVHTIICSAQQSVKDMPWISVDHYQVTPVAGVNTSYHEFSPSFYQNGLVFTSTKYAHGISSVQDKVTGENFSNMFYVPLNSSGEVSGKINYFTYGLNDCKHDGTWSLSNDGSTAFYTKNQKKHGTNGLKNLRIVTSTKSKFGWSRSKNLPFNNVNFSCCHPTLTADGQTLYFASDMPGGLGGMDLWKVSKKEGVWSAPVHCEGDINSAANEIFPVVAPDGTLSFASNRSGGAGGLDIYFADVEGLVSRAEAPVNSSGDDFGLITTQEGNWGFFTSNRAGGQGDDDLYRWVASDKMKSTPQKESTHTIWVMVYDNASKMLLPGVKCQLPDQKTFITDNTGISSVETSRQVSCLCQKEGYQPVSYNINVAEGVNRIPMEPMMMQTALTGKVITIPSNMPVSNATVFIKNGCTQNTLTITTLSDGVFNTHLDCKCTYEITASASGMETTRKSIVVQGPDCDRSKPLEVTMELSKPSVATGPAVEYKEGMVFQLDNIYYDYNKDNIRPDAARELDHLVQVMNQYPAMVIELGSHTDSRGNDAYNLDLSQRRATSAVQYIVAHGIASNRITARGFGETNLVNQCINGVRCSESDHQANRRTTVRIIKM